MLAAAVDFPEEYATKPDTAGAEKLDKSFGRSAEVQEASATDPTASVHSTPASTRAPPTIFRVTNAPPPKFLNPLASELGLITEKIAPLAISNTDWKIIQSVNLEPYFRAGKTLRQQLKRIAYACGKTEDTCPYLPTLKQLETQLAEAGQRAERVTDLFRAHAADGPNRKRRSLLPFVGKISKFLFGTLDEEDEENLRAAIAVDTDDTRATAALLANQTELVKRELSDIRNDTSKLAAAVSVLFDTERAEDRAHAALAAIEAFTYNMQQFNADTEVLTDAVLFAARGIVHPRIMPPEMITRSVATVKSTLANAEFPAPDGTVEAIPIMKISVLTVVYLENRLIYQLAVPLLDIQRYSLYKATPLPSIQSALSNSNVAAYIWPESRYFAISESNRAYMPIPTEKIANFKNLGIWRIFSNPEPVREIRSNAACEIRIAAGLPIKNIEKCDIRFKQLRDTFWLRLHKPNAWVYSALTQENIFVQCTRAEQYTATLSGIGILQLQPGCSAHTANARLSASRTFQSRATEAEFKTLEFNIRDILESTNMPHINPTEFKAAVIAEASSRVENQHEIKTEALERGAALHAIADKAKYIAEKNELLSKISRMGNTTAIFNYSFSSFIMIAVVAAIAIWFANRRRTRAAIAINIDSSSSEIQEGKAEVRRKLRELVADDRV